MHKRIGLTLLRNNAKIAQSVLNDSANSYGELLSQEEQRELRDTLRSLKNLLDMIVIPSDNGSDPEDESLQGTLKTLYSKMMIIFNREDQDWEWKYDSIFHENVSGKINHLVDLDYYDPDGSYEDDVRAYVEAVNDKCKDLGII